jgi:hypothetical protein
MVCIVFRSKNSAGLLLHQITGKIANCTVGDTLSLVEDRTCDVTRTVIHLRIKTVAWGCTHPGNPARQPGVEGCHVATWCILKRSPGIDRQDMIDPQDYRSIAQESGPFFKGLQSRKSCPHECCTHKWLMYLAR